ncbi:MAG: hypothetical protein Q8M29_18120 [Bacteroidota bacterium]|nr:hypothetical protein [Bacteroidota bacterium]
MKRVIQITLVLLLFSLTCSVRSQSDSSDLKSSVLKQLNSNNKYKAYYSKLSFHSYFDIIRQAGGGIEYAPWTFMNLDARIYGIYPFSPGSKFIFFDDYFNYNGVGTSLCLKFFPKSNNNGFYFGPYASLQYLEYRSRWISYHYSGEADIYMWQKQSKFILGIVPFTSMSIGIKKNYRNIGIDVFFGMGAGNYKERLVIQERRLAFTYPGYKDPYGPVPDTKQHKIAFPDAVFGLKLSYSINRKQIKTKKYYTNYFETCIYSVCEKQETQKIPAWILNPVARIVWESKNGKKSDELKPYKKALSKEYRKHAADEQYLIQYTNDMIDDYIKYHPRETKNK